MTTVEYTCHDYVTTVKWRIGNFIDAATRDDKRKFLCSEEFSLYKSRMRFILEFYPITRDDIKLKDSSAVYLMPKHLDNEKSVELSYKFWMENKDGQQLGNDTDNQNCFYKVGRGWGIKDFVHHSALYPPDSDFARDDVVFIYCLIRRNTQQPDFIPIRLDNSIAEHMWLFHDKNKELCTIQIGRKNFKVEKNLLQRRSSEFALMFEADVKPASMNVVKINDVKPDVMQAFIRYIHVDYLDKESAAFAEELLVVAEKYDVEKLKDECIEILKKGLNRDNILSRMILAFTHNLEELKWMLVDYATKKSSNGNAGVIMKSQEWAKLCSTDQKMADAIQKEIFSQILI